MNPVIKSCANVLIHVPDLVRYGSKPSREIEKGNLPIQKLEESLRKFEEALAYPPNQVFIGNLKPEELWESTWPWFKNPIVDAQRQGIYGEIMPEEEFYGLLKICDVHGYEMVWLEKNFSARIKEKLAGHPLFDEADIQKIGEGKTIEEIKEQLERGKSIALPLFCKDEIVGCFNKSKDEHAKEDRALDAHPLMEVLVAKSSAVLALKNLIKKAAIQPDDIDYILSCSEEAAGDRYNRGGGGLAKTIGEVCRCQNAAGPDIKSFCVGPVYAVIIGASLVKAGIAKKVAIVGGGCLAKLGMKFEGHLKNQMPIIEDTLGAVAFLITKNDKKSPIIRLDAVGKNSIKNGGSQGEVMKEVVLEPLKILGKKITEIDKYAVQLENPEITIPSENGDVPKKNYEMIAGLAILAKDLTPQEIGEFIKKHGMRGFAPTQGHIPAAVPYLGHAVDAIKEGQIQNAMFIARGSLFLSRMSHLNEGMSFIIEENSGKKKNPKSISPPSPKASTFVPGATADKSADKGGENV